MLIQAKVNFHNYH